MSALWTMARLLSSVDADILTLLGCHLTFYPALVGRFDSAAGSKFIPMYTITEVTHYITGERGYAVIDENGMYADGEFYSSESEALAAAADLELYDSTDPQVN